MRLKIEIRIVILICWLPVTSYSQNNSTIHKINVVIPEVALLGLVSDDATGITLNSTSPSEAGNSVDFSSAKNNNIWINYSSIISGNTKKRKVIAMVQGEIPQGVKLTVEASNFSGSGKGKLGETTGVTTLSNQPSDIIVGIGTCYTGKGINNGHYLTYKLETDGSSDDYALLSQQQTSVNVIYTLTDFN